MIALFGGVLLLVLLALGAPVAFSMAVAGAVGLYLVGGTALVVAMISTNTLSPVASYELMAVPMFILMAEFIIVSRIADDLFDAAAVWVGRTPGGLGVATILAGALFGSISGSSTAAAATLSSTSLPAMMRKGYSPRFAGGLVSVTGTLAMLIPPSLALVFYGIIAEVSIGRLLIAGIVPGLLVAVALAAYIVTIALLRPGTIPRGQAYPVRQKLSMLRVTGPMIALVLLVTGSLYSGVVTPTEASAIGAFGAMIIAALKRRLSLANGMEALKNTARITCMISFVIVGSYLFSYFFTLTQTTQAMANWIVGLDASPYLVLLILAVVYILLGTFLDTIAIIILTVPIILPVIVGIGYDPVWFGVCIVLMAELAMLTPPTGMVVFVVARYADRPVHEIFAGAFPYVIVLLGLMVLFAIWPQIILWLPNRMIN